MAKKQLRILVRSQISVIHHSLMIGPKISEKRIKIQRELMEMTSSEKGKGVLDSLGFNGWELVDVEVLPHGEATKTEFYFKKPL